MSIKKRGREYFQTFRAILMFLIKLLNILPYGGRNALLSIFRHTNGYIGLVIRYVLIASMAKK